MSKVLPFDVVICFDEDLSQSAFSYRVVLGVELVKSMKGVPVLQQSSLFRFQRNVHHQYTSKKKNQTSQYETLIALLPIKWKVQIYFCVNVKTKHLLTYSLWDYIIPLPNRIQISTAKQLYYTY